MAHHIDAPLRSAKTVLKAERRNQASPRVDGGFLHAPLAVPVFVIRMLNAYGLSVDSPVARMPCRVGVQDELAHRPVGLHLIVG